MTDNRERDSYTSIPGRRVRISEEGSEDSAGEAKAEDRLEGLGAAGSARTGGGGGGGARGAPGAASAARGTAAAGGG